MLYQRKNCLQVWLTDNKLTKVTLLKQSKLLGPFQQAETYLQAQMHHIGCRFGYPALFITYTKGRSTLWRQVGTYIHYSAISVKLTKLWMICKKTDSKVVSKRCFNQFCSKFKSWGLKYDINKSFRRDFGTRFKIPNKTNTIFSGSKGIFFFQINKKHRYRIPWSRSRRLNEKALGFMQEINKYGRMYMYILLIIHYTKSSFDEISLLHSKEVFTYNRKIHMCIKLKITRQ